jgi:hypothetical protein
MFKDERFKHRSDRELSLVLISEIDGDISTDSICWIHWDNVATYKGRITESIDNKIKYVLPSERLDLRSICEFESDSIAPAGGAGAEASSRKAYVLIGSIGVGIHVMHVANSTDRWYVSQTAVFVIRAFDLLHAVLTCGPRARTIGMSHPSGRQYDCVCNLDSGLNVSKLMLVLLATCTRHETFQRGAAAARA